MPMLLPTFVDVIRVGLEALIMIQLLIPMSGQGRRFREAGFPMPKPLVPINGRPMIERVLENFPQNWPCTFVLNESHRETDLPRVLKKLRPEGRQIFIAEHSEGPLRAIESALPHLDSAHPVFVNYCDYGMVWDSEAFEKMSEECDLAVVSYIGFHAHYLNPQMYAYSRLEKNRIVEVREKNSFTSNREEEFASAGGYFFRSVDLLKRAAQEQRKRNLQVGGEFYTSLTVQAALLLSSELNAQVFCVPYFFQWGTPGDLKRFAYWERMFQQDHEPGSVDQILMPMAGHGSRFQEITSVPKPLIPIFGKSMFQRALESLPQGKTTLIAREELRESLQGHDVKFLKNTPAGQAHSVLEGLDALEPGKPFVISSCDHAILMNRERWLRFVNTTDCAAAVFTMKEYPGCDDKPESYSYVQASGEDEFPEVKKVLVKKPSKDPFLVGTFWFRDSRELAEKIQKLENSGARVNGELYLDSVLNTYIEDGLVVREIPLDGYIGWGDPESLAEAMYWHEVYLEPKQTLRGRFPGVPA